MTRQARPRRSTLRALLAGLALFAAVDALAFRTRLYWPFTAPASNAGVTVRHAQLVPELHPPREQPTVLLLGDSRIVEACRPELLHALLGTARDSVHTAGVPGSSPRVQALLYEAIPRPQTGWRLVVLGLASYDDADAGEDLADRRLDLQFLPPLLGLGDAPGVAAEFDSARGRRDALLGALCKTYAWRHDLRDLLAAPIERARVVRRSRWSTAGARSYDGHAGSLVDVRVVDGRVVGAPDAATAAQLRAVVHRGAGVDNAAYRRRWLGRLADRVVADGGELVLLRLPTQVLPRLQPRVPATAVVDELAARPGVHALDHDLFAALESPDCFYDALHLNRAAGERFTRTLADALLRRFPDRLRK